MQMGHVGLITLVALLQVSCATPVYSEESPGGQRTPWTTSRVHGSPDPPRPYTTERAFPNLQIDRCVDMTYAPESNLIFVAELSGKIYSFPSEPNIEAADLAVDIAAEVDGAKQVYAFTFHPNFANNRYCYICYIKDSGQDDGTHVARFEVTKDNPPKIDASTETTMITWLSGGHNGCCLKFGPDGYLYISTGDATSPNPPDILRTGQDVSDLLSSILRIDVDQTEDDRNYRIPPDNPFVGRENTREEIWAYGFRNPWRMSFDAETGDLWVGDVGWELWEMLDRVEKGGNYGWSIVEGRQSTNPEWERGPTPILPPTLDHPHSESSSITDGLTYYGSRLEELYGTHIYGDYDTGKIWGFKFKDGQVVNHRELADTTHRIVAFGEDPQGEAYLLDHIAGTIHRLVPNTVDDSASQFPHQLSQTGIFADVANQIPAAGVVAYSINAPPWADHATSRRYVAIPDSEQITPTEQTWTFPSDSVLIKTIGINQVEGDASSHRKLETQILHFDGIDWQPYTYRWNNDETDASLVGASGEEIILPIPDPQAAGGVRQQTWRFAGRAECQRCHNKWSGPPLAFNTAQLNRTHNYDLGSANQLDTFAHFGLVTEPVSDDKRPQLVDPNNQSADLDQRARAYLQVNCAHCHRRNAGSAVLSKLHHDLPLEKTDTLGVRPSQGTFGIPAASVIEAGDPYRSVLLYRMSKVGGGRMPHIGSTEVDTAGIRLIHEWIKQIPVDLAEGNEPNEVGESTRASDRQHLDDLLSAENTQQQADELSTLLSTTSGALMLLHAINSQTLPADKTEVAIAAAAKHDDLQVRDLFERFLPPEQRTKRLGSVIDAKAILAIEGDAKRGKELFNATASVQCKNCHRIDKTGNEVGPDLSQIGKENDRFQLLESILEPSKRIDPAFVSYVVETGDGRLLTGLLVKKDGDEIILRDAQNKLITIPATEVEQLVPQKQSLMPELLLRDMTAQQVADLLVYLSSLK